ncbi:MAG TPA: phosphatidylglycerophosphatase A [Pyrinomonadaceae bacterium]|nr:phosphatidylglycerophosphatase A [Pyrinomonadaceae bacterium]HNU06347.1 phosphatidylglycerophosphatase A [Pyrinomonadaceae bacterium]
METQDEKRSFTDYITLALTTFGVGYLPLAPGTWGSMVGVAIYVGIEWFETSLLTSFSASGVAPAEIGAWMHSVNVILFLALCLAGVWASDRSTVLFNHKDPSRVVVDEVMGQLLVFLFIPFTLSWKLILAGFLLFRLFDIWKPYPIDSLQSLPAGIGVCADDLLAGVYGGACLSVIYAVSVSL